MKRFFSIILLALVYPSLACTNYIVTKGASTDGSVMISYAADSHTLYGELYHWPAQKWPAGSMLDIYEWDTGKYLGQIKQVAETYNVVGNTNEYQVAIGETTYGGREELVNPEGIMDYGSLIYVTLQRSKTAREAIKVMTDLVAEYGYCSSGESFSIADANEAWILEMIGKGKGEKGAVWVARRIPDGYVSGHANQARITTFPLKGKNTISSKKMKKIFNSKIENVYSEDVIKFARKKGYFKGKDADFSFSDTYAPVSFGGARFCEIRVWTMFNELSDDMSQYWNYAKGNVEHNKQLANGHENLNHYATNRMPLWIKPNRKVSPLDMFSYMRNHLEGTELDMTKDVGAGLHACPYRWRPLTWKVDGETYCNERATATQQTGFSFIAQLRSWLPRQVGAVNWFSVDDAGSTVYMPIYSSSTSVPNCLKVGNGDIMTYSETAAFWTFSLVSNFAYLRYDLIHPEIAKKQNEYETGYMSLVKKTDEAALEMLQTDPKKAVAYLTNTSKKNAEKLNKEWKDFFHYLFVKYVDGNVKTAREVPKGYKYYAPEVKQPGYSKEMYKRIVKETKDQFKMPKGGGH